MPEFQHRMASISRQSVVYFAGTMLTTAVGFPFKIYLAHKLGPQALGIYALGMTIVGFLGLFNGLGLPTAAARFVSAYRSRGDFNALRSFLGAGFITLCACNLLLGVLLFSVGSKIAVHVYHLPALSGYLWAFALIMFFGALNTFLGQVMAGYQDVSRRTIITHFFGTPANIVFAVLLISMGLGLTGYLAAQVASALLVLVLLAFFTWKMTPRVARGLRFRIADREVFTFSAAAFATTALEFVLAQADKIVLGSFLGATQVGIYAVAAALVAFVPIALTSVNQIFSPTISELHATGNWQMLQQLYSALTKWILVFTLPLALALIMFSRQFMIMFGPTFAAGSPVLAIGTAGQLVNCAVGSVGFLLLMSGNQMELLKIQAVNAGVMLILTFFFTSRMGIVGAAAAMAVTVVTTNVWCLSCVRRKLHLFPFNYGYLKLLFPLAVCSMLLAFLRHQFSMTSSSWCLPLSSLLTAYVSFLGAVAIVGLDERDREMTRFLWGKIAAKLKGNEVLV